MAVNPYTQFEQFRGTAETSPGQSDKDYLDTPDNPFAEFLQYRGQAPTPQPEDDYGSGIVYAFMRGFERLRALPDVAQGDYAELAEHYGNMDRWKMSEEDIERFERIRDTEGFWRKTGEVLKNPSMIGQVFMESLPMMVAPIAGAFAGGAAGTMVAPGPGTAAGMMVGGGAGSYAVEYFNSQAEFLSEHGVDLTNPDELKQAFQDPELMDAARVWADKRGVPIAIFDALSMGLAGRVAKPAAAMVGKVTGGRSLGAGGIAEFGVMQPGLGMAGEATAQLRSEGEITDQLDVILEGVAELPGGVIEAGVTRVLERGKGDKKKSDQLPDEESPLSALADVPEPDTRPIAATDIDPVTGKPVLRYDDLGEQRTEAQQEKDELDVALEDALQDLEMGIEMDALAGDVAREGADRALERQGSRNQQMLDMEAQRDAQLDKQRRAGDPDELSELDQAEAYYAEQLQEYEETETRGGRWVFTGVEQAEPQPAVWTEDGIEQSEPAPTPQHEWQKLTEGERAILARAKKDVQQSIEGIRTRREYEASRTPEKARQEEAAYAQQVDEQIAADEAAAEREGGEMVTPQGVEVEEEPIDVIGGQPTEAMRTGEEIINPAGGRPFGTSLGEALRGAQKAGKPRRGEGPDATAPAGPAAPAVPAPAVEYHDERMTDPALYDGLTALANDLVPGGGITLIPDLDAPGVTSAEEATSFKGRTKSVNPGWFQALASDEKVSVKYVQATVEKAKAGHRLGVKQKRVISSMLDTMEEQREQAEQEYAAQQAEEFEARAEDRAEREAIQAEGMGDLDEEARPLGRLAEAEIPFTPVTEEERAATRAKRKAVEPATTPKEGEFVPAQRYPVVQVMEDADGVTVSFGAYERTYQDLTKVQAEDRFREEFAEVLGSPEGRARAAGISPEEVEQGDVIEGETVEPAPALPEPESDLREYNKKAQTIADRLDIANAKSIAKAKIGDTVEFESRASSSIADVDSNYGYGLVIYQYGDAKLIAGMQYRGASVDPSRGNKPVTSPAGLFFTVEGGKGQHGIRYDKDFGENFEAEVIAEFREEEASALQEMEEAIDQQALVEEIFEDLEGEGPGYRNSMFLDEEEETFEMADVEDALLDNGWETDPLGSELGAVFTKGEQSIAIQEHDMEGQYTIHWYAGGEAVEAEPVPADQGKSGDLFSEGAMQMDIEEQAGKPELDTLADETEQMIIDLPDNVSETNTERNMVVGDVRRLKMNKHPRADDVAKLLQLRLDGWGFKIVREYPNGQRDVETTDLEGNTTSLTLKKGEPLHEAAVLVEEAQATEEIVGRVIEGSTTSLPELAARELEKDFANKKLTDIQRAALRVATRLALDSQEFDSSFGILEFTKHGVEAPARKGTANQEYTAGTITYNTVTQLINKGVMVGVEGSESRPGGMPNRLRVPNIPETTPTTPEGGMDLKGPTGEIPTDVSGIKEGPGSRFALENLAQPPQQNESGKTVQYTTQEKDLGDGISMLEFQETTVGTNVFGPSKSKRIPMRAIINVVTEQEKRDLTFGEEAELTPKQIEEGGVRIERIMYYDNGKGSIEATVDFPGEYMDGWAFEFEWKAPAASVPSPEEISTAANEAATSPENDLPQPTKAQKKAGNYKKGHIRFDAFDVTIENPIGSVRFGNMKMRDHYGYIKGTQGTDQDQIDVFVNEGAQHDFQGTVYIVDQLVDGKANGGFDEHKVMLGYKSKLDAIRAYRRNYQKGWSVGPITEMSMSQFMSWINERGANTRPASESSVFKANRQRQKKERRAARYERGKDILNAPSQAWLDAVIGRDERFQGDVPDIGMENALVEQVLALEESAKALETKPEPEPQPDTPTAIQNEIDRINQAFPEAKIQLIHSNEFITAISGNKSPSLIQRIKNKWDTMTSSAVFDFDTDTIYIFRNRVESVTHAQQLAVHEMFHKGISRAVGARMNPILDDFYKNMSAKQRVEFVNISRLYGLNERNIHDRREAVEEMLAMYAESGRIGPEAANWIAKMVQVIREWLASFNISTEANPWTDEDIRQLIAEAHGSLARRRDGVTGLTFEEEVVLDETGEVFVVENDAQTELLRLNKREQTFNRLRNCLA